MTRRKPSPTESAPSPTERSASLYLRRQITRFGIGEWKDIGGRPAGRTQAVEQLYQATRQRYIENRLMFKRGDCDLIHRRAISSFERGSPMRREIEAISA